MKGFVLAERLGKFLWLDILVTMIVFSIYGGSYCPDVNESHYLCKAKHFWDSSFCQGDLFLESADAHWFFFLTFGWPTQFMSLTAATWLGRWVCWFTIAVGWCRFISTLSNLRMLGTFSSLLFVAAVHYGQLSGEWVIGGCEAKCMAYGFAFLAFAAMLRNDWNWTAVWFGVSMAFHVVTGGWIALSVIGATLCSQCTAILFPKARTSIQGLLRINESSIKDNNSLPTASIENQSKNKRLTAICFLIGTMFCLVGFIPAVFLNHDVDTETAERAAMVYVFARLPHHLRVGGFSETRWALHSGIVFLTVMILICTSWILRHGIVEQEKSSQHQKPLKIGLLLLTCLFGAVFAAIGSLIDLFMSPFAANWSANLLRFYWFRWNDVAWPVALCSLVVLSIDQLSQMKYSQSWRFTAQLFFWSILVLPGGYLCVRRTRGVAISSIPPADYQSLIHVNTTKQQAESTYLDWFDVCRWINMSTPEQSLFLTPRNQQTFKWYAGRAEVVNWKDSPQNAKDLIEWFRRVKLVFATADNGGPELLHQVRVIQLYREFRFDYVVLDKRSDPTPLVLPIVFENETFAVFQMQDL